MSAVTRAELDVENPRMAEDLPPPKRSCCRINRVCASMVPLETLTCVSSISCALFGAFNTNTYASGGAYVAAAVLGAATALEIFVHVCWGRDRVAADLAKTVENGDKLADKVGDTAEKVDEVAEQLKAANLALKERTDALANAQKDFAQAQSDLNAEVEKLSQTNQDLKGVIEGYKSENATLGQHVEQLQGVIKTIQEQLEKFNHHNNELKKNVGELGDVVNEFGGQDDSLKVVFGEVDKELDVNIDELGKQISSVQLQSQEIVTILTGQIHDLTETIKALTTSQENVDKDEDDIRKRNEELQEVEAKLSAVNAEITMRREEFEQINKALIASQESLASVLKKITTAGSQLSGDTVNFEKVTSSLEKVAKRMSGMIEQMAAVTLAMNENFNKAQKQKEEIDSL